MGWYIKRFIDEVEQKDGKQMNNIPRRAYAEKQEVAEKAIHAAINEVELIGCAESLTLAVERLQSALKIVSDFIDMRNKEMKTLE
jgi:hypothetical protein